MKQMDNPFTSLSEDEKRLLDLSSDYQNLRSLYQASRSMRNHHSDTIRLRLNMRLLQREIEALEERINKKKDNEARNSFAF